MCIFIIYTTRIVDMETVENWLLKVDGRIESMGLWAPGMIFALRSISIIIPMLPGTYCSVLSGYFFGFQEGLLIIFLADLMACSSSFFLSRKFGRGFIRKIVGNRLMLRVEGFSKKHLEKNFFLMTSFLMTQFFDFVCYGVGLTKVPWRKFVPALIISILISDAPFVASGYAFKELGSINVQQILNINVKNLPGKPLITLISSIVLIFSLGILNIYLQKRTEASVDRH